MTSEKLSQFFFLFSFLDWPHYAGLHHFAFSTFPMFIKLFPFFITSAIHTELLLDSQKAHIHTQIKTFRWFILYGTLFIL